jgi:hypothetical protein
MNTRSPYFALLPQFAGGVAALLCGTAVLAFLPYATWFDFEPMPGNAASVPDLTQPDKSGVADPEPAAPVVSPERMRPKCPECGVVDSVRNVNAEDDGSPRFEITVRLRDGSTRVNRVTDPTQWRVGERITFIE